MTTIELMTENPKEMVELITRIKEVEGLSNGRRPMHPMPEGYQMRDRSAITLFRMEGLAKASEKEKAKNEAEKIVGKLIEDLRAHADYIDGMPLPEDMQGNLRLAARLLEILSNSQELRRNLDDNEHVMICEAAAK